MPSIPGAGVRPTQLAMGDLGLAIPDLGIALEDLSHDLLERAQQIPASVDAGGAERITSIDDLVWFKVKTSSWRGAATRHEVFDSPDGDADASVVGCWWLGAGGSRRADSGQTDFYEQLKLKCAARRKAANVGGFGLQTASSSVHLLPGNWDADRLRAELATHTYLRLTAVVRQMAARSMRDGKPYGFDFAGTPLTILIRADGGLAYILISVVGITNSETFALLLSSIPGIASDDWMPEPEGVADLAPEAGQLLWSAPYLLMPKQHYLTSRSSSYMAKPPPSGGARWGLREELRTPDR